MQNTEGAFATLSTSTIDQMLSFFGFHDVGSLVISALFVLIAITFIISGAIFLVRKRKERLEELNRIVHEVQSASELPKISEPVPLSVEKKISQVRTKPQSEKPKKAKPAPVVAEKKPVEPAPLKPAKTALIEAKQEPIKESPKSVKKEVLEELPKKSVPIIAEVIPEPPKEPLVEIEEPSPLVEPIIPKKGLGSALKNTRGGFMQRLARLFSASHEISDDDFEAMEAILFTADIGIKTAQKLLDNVRERVKSEKNTSSSFLRQALKEEMRTIFANVATPKLHQEPFNVVMFVGVNGAGKTTSIGKLGAQLKDQGKKVYFGAGDTFRAAAVKQLSLWGERIGVPVVSGKENSDSASVLFDTIEQAKKGQAEVVLCDTAGRLHTKSELMDELKKVHRVVNKAHAGAPHEVFLVIDATMGQNAIAQAREFAQATPLTGVVLSKLDGTAKGGVALGIVDELKVPIRYVGIGEQVDDLKEFDADQFIEALFDESNE